LKLQAEVQGGPAAKKLKIDEGTFLLLFFLLFFHFRYVMLFLLCSFTGMDVIPDAAIEEQEQPLCALLRREFDDFKRDHKAHIRWGSYEAEETTIHFRINKKKVSVRHPSLKV
jgi:hypothetical protein